jgi:ABC-type branched-subunit amino acid transport system substrate-binding protein
MTTLALVLAQAQTVETRSRAWVWLVAAGLLVAVVLVGFIARALVRSLPDDVRTPVTRAVRQNGTPLGIGVALLITALVFGLWSAGLPVIQRAGKANTNVQAAAGASTDNTTSVAGDTAAGDSTSGGGPAASGAARTNTPTTIRPGLSLGAPSNLAIKEPNLFTGANNTRGITDTTIKVCGHAALSLGAVLNTKPEDLLVFWRYLNDKGGIYGRKFDVSLEDDQYSAEGGVPAAQKCAERKPFMIFGALGSDVLPPVRLWAEQNKELYLYGFTIKKGSENLRYSYSTVISTEDLVLVMADQTVRTFAGKKVGVMWRNSNNIQPARDAYKKYVAAHGIQVVADLPVQKSQGSYSSEILTLQQKGAEVVIILDDAVSQLNVIKQAKTQQYSPYWLVFPFNIQTQTLGNDALKPPIRGPNLAPAYECHSFDGPYASYADDIREFEAAYAKYSPNTDLCGIAGDIAWGGWNGFKAMAALFEACGPNCTRNRFAGVMESGYKAKVGAACPLDFSGDKHHGGYYADLLEAYMGPRNRAALRNSERCVRAPA